MIYIVIVALILGSYPVGHWALKEEDTDLFDVTLTIWMGLCFIGMVAMFIAPIWYHVKVLF